MDIISGLPDELLVKILSFLPTKVVVSTSFLSKRWESLWLWIPKLEFVVMNHEKSNLPPRGFITRNLSLLKHPVLESFRLQCFSSTFQPEDIKHWVETTVSRCVRELHICYWWEDTLYSEPYVLLPSSLYTCESLVTLKLNGYNIIVDVPQTVDLPCLKTLELGDVIYLREDSLRLLLSYCPVLEDLTIYRYRDDNLKTVVITVPSLLRLSLPIDGGCDGNGYEIVTPSLKYFKVTGYYTENFSYSYLIAHMPKVEEVDLSIIEDVERLFESLTSVERLSLSVFYTYKYESVYRNGIVFNQLKQLKLRIKCDYWLQFLVRLLEDSPKLRILKILVDSEPRFQYKHEWLSWYNDHNSIPKCLLESLETFEFKGYTATQEEQDFVDYILENARHLKSSSISRLPCYVRLYN